MRLAAVLESLQHVSGDLSQDVDEKMKAEAGLSRDRVQAAESAAKLTEKGTDHAVLIPVQQIH